MEKPILKDDKAFHDIVFKVGGIELNFENVMKAIDNNIDKMIEEKAQTIVNNKFVDLQDDLEDLKQRVLNQKERYKYE